MATSTNKRSKRSKDPKGGDKDMRQLQEHVRNLESENQCLQKSFVALILHFGRVQYNLRQILRGDPSERDAHLVELEKIAFEGLDVSGVFGEIPQIKSEPCIADDLRHKQAEMIKEMEDQLTALKNLQKKQVSAKAPEPESEVEAESEWDTESDLGSEKYWRVSSLENSESSDPSSTKVNQLREAIMEWIRSETRVPNGPSCSKRM